MDGEAGALEAQSDLLSAEARPQEQGRIWLPLWLFAALAVFLLLLGAARVNTAPFTDVAEYQCYALAFWHGTSAATAPSASVCHAFLGPTSSGAFTTLPREYGPLAMALFSLPVIGPTAAYPWLFAGTMILIVLGVALLLRHVGPVGAGHAWLLYVMLGSAATAAARFDMAPAACTLLALVALKRGRQEWAYAALAAGTLLKLFPALLLPLFVIESWRARRAAPHWRGLGVYAAIVAAVEGLALVLSPSSVLAPLTFMQGRCVQIESLPATLSALVAVIRGQGLSFIIGANSICQVSPGLGAFGAVCTGVALLGIAAVVALRWRGALSLGLAAILVLALAMLGSKVFSPQYLLWISPLVAYEFGLRDLRVFGGWCAVCLATTLCYPFSYTSLLLTVTHTSPDTAVPLTAGLRNALLLAAVATTVVGSIVTWRRERGYIPRTSPGSRAGE